MKILITGANGYIGKRLLLLLAEDGHEIVALVRSKRRLSIPEHLESQVQVMEADLLKEESLKNFPKDIVAAYYLVHSMSDRSNGFLDLELRAANHFLSYLEKTQARQLIYLSGFSHASKSSEHLLARKKVDDILRQGRVAVTTLCAGIVIGSGSASFEITRDLVEKLPVMIAPRWLYSKCQPIGIFDVLYYLKKVLLHPPCFRRSFDIGGPDVLSYKEMLLGLARVRGLQRWIFTVPFLSPRLSSWWLFFISSTSFSLSRALVASLKVDSVCKEYSIHEIFPHEPLAYEQAVIRAFEKIEQNAVVSSWKDALVHSHLSPRLLRYIEVPETACFKHIYKESYSISKEKVLDKLWSIGGNTGWFYMNWIWVLRGYVDRMVGGVGLRRGRRHPQDLQNGDALDFWRVLHADKDRGRLLLYAEMRLPGEGWLEWKVSGDETQTHICQTATFRPLGLLGRLYWYMLVPIHGLIFKGMCDNLVKEAENSCGKKELSMGSASCHSLEDRD